MRLTGHVEMQSSAVETSDLICPRCGSDHLHHGQVDIYNRGEDEQILTHVNISASADVSVKRRASNEVANPSRRRWGLSIRFDCEGCSTDDVDDVIEMTIAQHKGQTEIGWRFSERKPREA